MTYRTADLEYGAEYWESMDGGRGCHDSTMWSDIAHEVAEVVFYDKRTNTDRSGEYTAVDVGCGLGFFVDHLNRRGCETFGLDISHWALENAPDSVREKLRWFDLTATDNSFFGLSRFSLVTTFETLEHLPADKALQAVQHLYNMVKPGGLLVASVCVVGRNGSEEGGDYGDPTHQNVVTRGWWEALFADVGFTVEPEMEAQFRSYWLWHQHNGVFVYRKH